jgi:hypothetical protein
MDLSSVLADLPGRVILSLLTAAIVASLSLLSRSFRQIVFYKRHEFELDYDRAWKTCTWDIQWEGFRVTIEVAGVRRAFIKSVLIKVNGTDPGRQFDELEVSDTFHHIDRWPLSFKLYSIVREKHADDTKRYRLLWVLRRRRW